MKRVVVVLGAHRAGTSLAMQAVERAGVRLGSDLIEADEWNTGGYAEQTSIMKAHDAALEAIGRPWSVPAGLLPIDPDVWRGESLVSARTELMRIVREQLAAGDGHPWGFKDPRTAMLLPLWKQVFAELDVDPLYVLAVRHPDAVAASLARRDGFPTPQSQLLWLRTYLDALRHTAGRIGAVVHYERWFGDPLRQSEELLDALEPLDVLPVEPEYLAGAASRDLRHHVPGSDQPLEPVVAELYRWLCFAHPDDGRLEVDDIVASCASAEQALTQAWVGGSWQNQYHMINALEQSNDPPQVWCSRVDGASSRCLMMQPPNRFTVEIPDGAAGELHFAVTLHPDVWERDDSGPCRFEAQVDQRVQVATALDPVGLPADRHWHEFEIAVPENSDGRHIVVLETASLGEGVDFRWALWREPVFKRR